MKYYMFRDLNHGDNLLEGRTHHSAGVVDKVYGDIENPLKSGKDLSVKYLHPFEGYIVDSWRAFSEVELFEVHQYEYDNMQKVFEDIIYKI